MTAVRSGMKQLCVAVALCGAVVSSARAEGSMAVLTYAVSFPGSNMKDFIDETSFLGLEFAARTTARYRSSLLIGMTVGFEVFDQHSSDPIQMENGTVSGRQARYLNTVPLLLTAHYYFGPRHGLHAFGGVGVGTLFVYQTFQLGVFEFESGTWHLAVAPEAGVQYPIGGATEIYASGRYNYAFENGASLTGESIAWNYWSLNVGLAWSSW